MGDVGEQLLDVALGLTFIFFALSLVGFYALITVAPAAVGEISGRVFYVWFSVFNLFSTMVFWALMADRFALEQSKRLFGVIAAGGTLGAIAGPWLASRLALIGTPRWMALIVAGLTPCCEISSGPLATIASDSEPARYVS